MANHERKQEEACAIPVPEEEVAEALPLSPEEIEGAEPIYVGPLENLDLKIEEEAHAIETAAEFILRETEAIPHIVYSPEDMNELASISNRLKAAIEAEESGQQIIEESPQEEGELDFEAMGKGIEELQEREVSEESRLTLNQVIENLQESFGDAAMNFYGPLYEAYVVTQMIPEGVSEEDWPEQFQQLKKTDPSKAGEMIMKAVQSANEDLPQSEINKIQEAMFDVVQDRSDRYKQIRSQQK